MESHVQAAVELPRQNISFNFPDGPLHPILVRLLEQRALSPEQIQDFFSWDLKSLPPLGQMLDMAKAAARIADALEKQEKVGIYGDYDVDGTTSCALFYHFFSLLGMQVQMFQPSRFIEGYGLHVSSIDLAIEKGVQLLITVDCGITSFAAQKHAREKGMDLIVTDHHADGGTEGPNAYAIVNPNRRDEDPQSPLRYLAGVGVAFAVCVQVKSEWEKRGNNCPSLYQLLPFVAVGTISDLVRLTPVNLKLVRHGLRLLKEGQYPGLRVFFTEEERKRRIIPSEKISFFIGPLINSKGRLDHPERALNVLVAQDFTEAFQNYCHLDICNKERKILQAQVFEEAREDVLKQLQQQEHLISVVYRPDWHEGVVGIVASKLVETFKVPAIVLTNSEDKNFIKGSARTAGSLDIFSLLNQQQHFFTKFGGHKAAAGMTLPRENLLPLTQALQAQLGQMPAIIRTAEESFDLNISIHDIDVPLARQLEKFEPFGSGNPRPIFRMQDAQVESFQLMKDKHVRWNIVGKKGYLTKQAKGVSFNYIGKWGFLSPQEIIEAQKISLPTIQFTLGINHFKGNEYLQLLVDKIYFAGM